ncbi:MAG: lytic transglycosylase domain-containing protein [Deltaproteobacteria bacterium]|nr:lytic transglycosylase domain-containing protein [Deltaproteobacteria bacterium]
MDEAFRLSYSHTLQTPSPDPLAFIADLEPVMPKPVTVLTIADAVAYELIRRSRTLNETDALRTATVIVHESLELGYDPLLVLAVIYVESYFDNYAISPVGAEGLMQIMPATGQWLAEQMGLGYTLAHTFDPTRNVRLGIRYLVRLENQFKGNTAFALTAYNRGPSATKYILRHHNGRLPKNIRDAYASKVLLRYRALRVLYGSLPIT